MSEYIPVIAPCAWEGDMTTAVGLGVPWHSDTGYREAAMILERAATQCVEPERYQQPLLID